MRPKIFLDESVINAFTQEEVRLQYKPIMVHEKGMNEPTLDYIKQRITKSEDIVTQESGSPFKKMKLNDLPGKMLRLDQIPCFQLYLDNMGPGFRECLTGSSQLG